MHVVLAVPDVRARRSRSTLSRTCVNVHSWCRIPSSSLLHYFHTRAYRKVGVYSKEEDRFDEPSSVDFSTYYTTPFAAAHFHSSESALADPTTHFCCCCSSSFSTARFSSCTFTLLHTLRIFAPPPFCHSSLTVNKSSSSSSSSLLPASRLYTQAIPDYRAIRHT